MSSTTAPVAPAALQHRRPGSGGEAESALLFVGLFLLMAAASYGRPVSFDGQVMYAVARAMLHGRLHLELGQAPFYHPPVRQFAAQFPYSKYGIGVSLVVLPLYGLARLMGTSPGQVVVLANPLLVAAGAVLVHRLGLTLGWSRRLALSIAVGYALLTMMLQDSTDLFSEPGVAVGIGLVLLGLLRLRDGRRASGLLTGAGVAIAVLFRTDSLLLVAPAVLAAPLLLPRGNRVRPITRQAVAFALPVLASLGWTLYYAEVATGQLLPRTYGGTFTAPFWTGFYGQLIGPEKASSFTTLAAVRSPRVVVLYRRERALTVLLVLLAGARLLFYARWSYWFGGVAWGPRFLDPAVLPACLLAGDRSARYPGSVSCAAGPLVSSSSVWSAGARWSTSPRSG